MLFLKSITSTANAEVKHFSLLNKSHKYREECGQFTVEGIRLCGDAAKSSVKIEKLYFTPQAREKYAQDVERLVAFCDEACEVSEAVSARLSDTKSPQGVFGVCKMKTGTLSVDGILGGGRYIALENVQDPSNLGAAARTAEALGLDGMAVFGGCDIFSPKALRASMGAFFRLPVLIEPDGVQTVKALTDGGVCTFACVPDSAALDVRELKTGGSTLAVIGNEGNGISEEMKKACRFIVTVPMRGRAESLNASHAATIVMWEMTRNG